MINKGKIHGLVSFAIFELTIVLSVYTIALKSLLFAAIYFIGCVVAAAVILFLFCAKCTTKNNCSHIYPGNLAQLFPDKLNERYRKTDYFGTGVSLTFVFIVPQFWLWSYKVLFIVFWVLSIIAILQINGFVCAKCENTKCAMCKKK